MRKGPVQLESDAKQSYMKALAERNAERRFSDALKNVPAEEKPPPVNEPQEESIEQPETRQDAKNPSDEVKAETADEEEIPAASEGLVGNEESDQETGGDNNPDKIVWKLPPEENNKKKKKKSKNKKK